MNNLSIKDIEDFYWDEFNSDYDERPVDIYTFLNDDYFLGQAYAGTMYKIWKDLLTEMYPSPFLSPHWLICLRGAIGLGKSITSNTILLYELYKLLCLKNPQAFYNMMPGTVITMFLMNMSLKNAKDVGFTKLVTAIGNSPFFSSAREKQLRERVRSSDGTILPMFPKLLDIQIGSQQQMTIGRDVFLALIDEANFDIRKGQAMANFNSLLRRMESRFMDTGGTIPGKLVVLSSESETGSAMNQIVETYKTDPKVLVKRYALWDAKPHIYCGDKFLVYAGDLTRQPKFIEDESIIQKELLDQQRVVEVPIEHKTSFVADITKALQDIAGVPTMGQSSFITQTHMIAKASVIDNPFDREIVILDQFSKDETIQQYYQVKFANQVIEPSRPRCIHVDLGLSEDKAGISMIHLGPPVLSLDFDPDTGQYREVSERTFEFDFHLAIQAKSGQQIPLSKIEDFIYHLRDVLKINIQAVTFDQFQSAQLIQNLKANKFNAFVYSVDRTIDAYALLRTCLYEERVKLAKHNLLQLELQYGKRVIGSNGQQKFDHTENENAPNPNSKDVSDSAAGCIWICDQLAPTLEQQESMARELKEYNKANSQVKQTTIEKLTGTNLASLKGNTWNKETMTLN